MAWIKRNLYFVIGLAVGIILSGVSGYFLYAAIGANADAKAETDTAMSQYTDMDSKKDNYPSQTNIQIAIEDSNQVAQLVGAFRRSFVNFPPPTKMGVNEFVEYLNRQIDQFRVEASNANVTLDVPDYSFGFSGLPKSLSIRQSSIAPWLEQLEEVRSILDVLYAAKINALIAIQRPAVENEFSQGGIDYLGELGTSNQVAVTTPYRISFRGFSDELANVLEGFAHSSHCFLVKDLEVEPARGGSEIGAAEPMAQSYGSASPSDPRFSPYPRSYRGAPGSGLPGGGSPGAYRRAPEPQGPMAPENGLAPGGPVTLLKPEQLKVVMTIEVVKLNKTR